MPRLSAWLRWVPVLAWIALISYWSSQSQVPLDHPKILALLGEARDKVAHALAFGVLGIFALVAFHGSRLAGARAVAFVSIFGAIDEWHQSFRPGRSPDVADWLVDTLAAVACVGVAYLVLEAYRGFRERTRIADPWATPPRSLREQARTGVRAWQRSTSGSWKHVAPVAAAAILLVSLGGVSIYKQRSPYGVAVRAMELSGEAVQRVVPDRIERRVASVAQAGLDTARQVRSGLRARLAG